MGKEHPKAADKAIPPMAASADPQDLIGLNRNTANVLANCWQN